MTNSQRWNDATCTASDNLGSDDAARARNRHYVPSRVVGYDQRRLASFFVGLVAAPFGS